MSYEVPGTAGFLVKIDGSDNGNVSISLGSHFKERFAVVSPEEALQLGSALIGYAWPFIEDTETS